MRIIQVIHSLTFGGAENQVILLSNGLKEKGHDILLCAPQNSWLEDQAKKYQIQFEHLRMRGIADILSYIKLHNLIKSFQADICHAHQVRPSQYVGWASKGTRAIPICTAHSTGVRKHMRSCKHIIGVSDAVLANLIKNNYPKEILTRIYNGVPKVTYYDRQKTREELGIDHTQFAIVSTGRFHPDKGFDLLIDIMDDLPNTIHLYLMGDETTEYGKSLTSQNHPRVHFLGYRSDVQQLLPAFDLYVAPSRREAFSLSLAEAEAAGLPIVASRVGGIPEVVSEEINGLLVPVNDKKAFSDSIKTLFTNKSLCKDFALAGQKRFKDHFTVENMVNETEALYERLLHS